MGREQDMGGSLEEIEKAGLTELPPIASSFRAASTALSGIRTSSMFVTGGPFGSNSPADAFGSFLDAMTATTRRSGNVLDDVAEALVTTARDFARTDADIRAAFEAAGGTLP